MRRTLAWKYLWAGRGSPLPGLIAILACALLIAGCGDDSAPVGTAGVSENDDDPDAGLELSGSKPACSARNTGGPVFPGGPTVPRLIRINFFTNSGSEKDRNTALEMCSDLLREPDLEKALELVAFIEENSIAGQEQQVLLSNAFLCLAEGKPAGATDCASQLPQPGEGFFQIVPPEGTGGPVDAGDGFSAYSLESGWSLEPRIVTYEILDDTFLLDFDGPQFPKYRRYGTIPAGPFDTPGSGNIFQCVVFDDELFDGTTIRLAKNFEAPDDPNGTFVPFLETTEDPDDGIEFFEAPEGGTFTPLECPDEPAVTSRTALPGSVEPGAGVQRGGKKGPGGAGLAGTVKKPIGGTVSSFSEWGFVDIAFLGEPPVITSVDFPEQISNQPGTGGDNEAVVGFSDPDGDVTSVVIEAISGPASGGELPLELEGVTEGTFSFFFGCFAAEPCGTGPVTLGLVLKDAGGNSSEQFQFSFEVVDPTLTQSPSAAGAPGSLGPPVGLPPAGGD